MVQIEIHVVVPMRISLEPVPFAYFRNIFFLPAMETTNLQQLHRIPVREVRDWFQKHPTDERDFPVTEAMNLQQLLQDPVSAVRDWFQQHPTMESFLPTNLDDRIMQKII